jgi:hypothetical protein
VLIIVLFLSLLSFSHVGWGHERFNSKEIIWAHKNVNNDLDFGVILNEMIFLFQIITNRLIIHLTTAHTWLAPGSDAHASLAHCATNHVPWSCHIRKQKSEFHIFMQQ